MRRSSFQFSNAAIILIALNIIMFVLQQVISGLTENLMLISSDIITRPWIIVTSMFLHGGGSHLLFNMYALLLFGTLIEQRIGTKRFVGIYFVSGILAALGFSIFQEFIIGSTGAAVGASGGMMGILGVTIMLLPDLRILMFFVIPMSMRTAGIVFAIIDLLGIFGFGIPGIANTAHLFGLAAGVGYGYYLLKQKSNFQRNFAKPRKHPVHIMRKAPPKGTKVYDVNSSIEMSKEEMDEYLKNGKL